MLRVQRIVACLAFLGAWFPLLIAQGLTPRPKPDDYPAHAPLSEGVILAAENLLHTLPAAQGSSSGALVANDYLVIEAAVFGPSKQRVDLAAAHFTLMVSTGKNSRTAIHSDAPGFVASSIKFSDWTPRPAGTLSGGVGNVGGTIGTQSQAPHFPGDPSVRPPYPSPVPSEPSPAGIETEPPVPIEDRVQRAALPEGEHGPPVAGLLFFQFRGKTKSIKSLELNYDGPAGKVTLKLD